MATYLAALYFQNEIERQSLRNERVFRQRSNAFSLPDNLFLELYRLPKNLVVYLCNKLGNELVTVSGVNTALSIETKVLCALSFYATGSYQRAVGVNYQLGLSQSAVSRCIKKVTSAVNKIMLNEEIYFPEANEYINLKQEFLEIANFPGVIGAIDCTHVPIKVPVTEGNNNLEAAYVNRKGYHSINVQMICDAKLLILNINTKYPGRSHDSFIWRNSTLRDLLEEENRCSGEIKGWLLGDSGYPLEPWLLTPVMNPQSTSEHVYNRKHARTRSTIERCFGVLKSRFRCLSKERILCYAPTTASEIINACAVLHNISIKNSVPVPEINVSEDEIPSTITDVHGNGLSVRNRIIRNFFKLF